MLKKQPMTFALFFGNRGFFPGELIADARRELKQAVEAAGFQALMMDESLTRYGAVETQEEGKKYAEFLRLHQGEYQGVILCLPNFGDENGASVALRDCGVPILVQAYPDEVGKMDFANRRDALCGKTAMCNVLRQNRLPYTLLRPFTVHPLSDSFQIQLRQFAGVCRVVQGLKRLHIGSIGARTTAFKTVRVDEIAMQNAGIDTETFDLSEVFRRARSIDAKRVEAKAQDYLKITNYAVFPREKLLTIASLGAAIDDIIQEYRLDGVAVRCWNEMQVEFGVAPCLILCDLNQRGIAASCEVDLANTVMMKALSLAADSPCMLLDINNNYNDDENKCVLFHCGPVPSSLLEGKGETIEHKMFAKSYGPGSGVGVNKGKIRPGNTTFGSLKTENGKLCAFVGEGVLRDDPLDPEFFGSGTVLQTGYTQDLLEYIAENGYRHHLGLVPGNVQSIVAEAFENYLGYQTHSFKG